MHNGSESVTGKDIGSYFRTGHIFSEGDLNTEALTAWRKGFKYRRR